MKNKRLYLTLLFFCGILTLMMAQSKVTGKISDAKGDALIGASVVEKGTTNGSVTDIDGNFSLTVKSGATISVSMVGYESQDIPVGSQSTINVTLSEGVSLSEVVVTALGIERAQKTLTYAAQKIGGDKVNQVRDANFVNTLSGKAAGIVVTQAAGGPGSATRVVLRGNRSIQGNNNALFVIDGVPVDNTIAGGSVGNDFGGYQGSDGAANINPDDIESMSILKGAAASVLYGSRAANGVVLITTKKGKAGKISVDVNSGLVAESPSLLPALQNDYGQGNGGVSNTTASGSWGGKTTTYPNNIKDFFRTALSANNSIGITGGTDKMTTYFSYTNNKNQGIIPNNDLSRNTFTLRLSNQLSKRLSTDAKVTYVNQTINNKIKVGEESGIVQNIYKIPRSISNESIKEFEDPKTGDPKYWTSSSIYMNPYWTLNRTLNDEVRNRVTSLVSAKYEIMNGLNITGRASIDRYTDKITRKFYDKTLLFAQQGGHYTEGYYDVMERNLEAFLNGNHKLSSDLSLNYVLGTSVSRREFGQTFVDASGLLVPNKFDLSFASSRSTSTSNAKREIQSVFASAQFGYKDYLFLDITGRNDWASTLPKDNNSYFYPSVGLNAVISDMTTMPSWISFMKARASWTKVGNDLPQGILLQTYSFEQGGTGGFIRRDGTLPIPDAKPELTTSLEFGLDWRLFKNRLGIDLTWYKTNSVNQLLSLDLAAPSGFDRQYINAGNIQNTGIELTLNASPIRNAKGFNWDMAVNFAKNNPKVVELASDIKQAFLAGGYGRTAGPVVQEGGKYGDLYGEGWKRDAQGRFLVDANGKPIGSTANLTGLPGGQTLVGNYNPDFMLGWNNTFSYKNFTLGVLVDGRFGGVMVSGSEANFAFDGTASYTSAFRDGGLILDAVTATGEKNTKAINAETFWTTVSGGRYSYGEFFAYDATNIRIRELILGYTLPIKNNVIKTAKLSLVGRNLLFLYRGSAILDIAGMPKRKMNFDPDINLGAGNFQGIEYGNLPSTRTIGLNLQLGF
jgi:TonB-linked SusC/RagA family outer membrane protein